MKTDVERRLDEISQAASAVSLALFVGLAALVGAVCWVGSELREVRRALGGVSLQAEPAMIRPAPKLFEPIDLAPELAE